jgi:hypothetical protein
MELIIFTKEELIRFRTSKPMMGVKSKPPMGGRNFLTGLKIPAEISSIICNKGWLFPGATQLKTTEPITQ